jgi:hypothetical protein
VPSDSNSNSEDQRAKARYAAPKPTIDEILAAVARHNKIGTNFLKTDIETALTFAGTARAAENSEDRARNLRAARKAYDTVVRLAERVELTGHDARIPGRSLARLKSELRGLGEEC